MVIEFINIRYRGNHSICRGFFPKFRNRYLPKYVCDKCVHKYFQGFEFSGNIRMKMGDSGHIYLLILFSSSSEG